MLGLESLSPTQQKAIQYGVPLVAAIALGTKLVKSKQAAPAAAPAPVATAATTGLIMPSTSAVDVGQLGEFESSITGALVGLQQAVTQLEGSSANTPPLTPSPATPPPAASGGAVPFVYTVEYGDNLASIAAKVNKFITDRSGNPSHITAASIARINHLSGPDAYVPMGTPLVMGE